MRNVLFPLILLVPLATRASSQVPAIGERLPPIELSGLAKTEAKSFSDFYGHAVLLDFFADWCAPCAASVPHLNELQEKFGARGLEIVAVTADKPAKIEPWVAARGVNYAYGYDPASKLYQQWGINSIPFAVLVDPFGTVVWSGDPRKLGQEQIERALDGALTRPVVPWPVEARDLASALARGEYAAALKAAGAVQVSAAFDPAALVRARIDALATHLEHLIEREEYSAALSFGERAAKELAPLPEGERIAARLKELGADPAVQAELAALERLKALEQRALTVKSIEDAEVLRPEVEAMTKELAGKKLERRAQQLLASIDRALARHKKKS